jgi:predicted ATPase
LACICELAKLTPVAVLVDIIQSLSESMVVLVGLPGAGKTAFYRRVLRDRGFVRRDARSYSSRQAFILAVDELVAREISVNSVFASTASLESLTETRLSSVCVYADPARGFLC